MNSSSGGYVRVRCSIVWLQVHVPIIVVGFFFRTACTVVGNNIVRTLFWSSSVANSRGNFLVTTCWYSWMSYSRDEHAHTHSLGRGEHWSPFGSASLETRCVCREIFFDTFWWQHWVYGYRYASLFVWSACSRTVPRIVCRMRYTSMLTVEWRCTTTQHTVRRLEVECYFTRVETIRWYSKWFFKRKFVQISR